MAAKPVVVGTDGSEESLRAVDWAAREAVLRGLPLRIVSAAALPPRMVERQAEAVSGLDTVSDALRKNRDRALAAAAERVPQSPLTCRSTSISCPERQCTPLSRPDRVRRCWSWAPAASVRSPRWSSAR